MIGKDKSEAMLDELVTLDKFTDLAEAYIIKGMLETNGIPCVVDGGVLSSVYPANLEFSMVRVMVRRRDLLMAVNLVKAG
ncbi:MAG: DUF2007 domain-containing protein [Muribaculaceae bacterium]|nr:DUF2007 domain-containing protein [Muribaculaceae bacterium]MDE5935461.1 DUF2007 domain-containing protein [Muribaculaceae bacterium]MDE6093858.1 DUF2007 domain-containing protein [Muribaculaceae bacterium]MDE6344837.1 DUF2007 domain-containing protein [Muribaculaceae bacterium]MDE6503353.1 DUF2007 domain-containing protein [Muribaculaceae bacterium]